MSLECACVHYNNGRCKKFTDDKHTSWCDAEGFCKYIEPSNADRIRAMSDEELSVFLWGFEKEEICRENEYFITRRKLDEWLKQHAEGD